MEPTVEMKDKLSKDILQAFYPVHERHPVLEAHLMYGTSQATMAHVLEISKQAMSFYLTGQRPLPAKHEIELLRLLSICNGEAVKLRETMKKNLEENELPPYVRRPTRIECDKLDIAIKLGSAAIGTRMGQLNIELLSK